jgi:3-hydroxybutyryl-CoA dehydrogenase
MTTVERIAVIGAGTMGHGIAYVACAAGVPVSLHDASAEALTAAGGRVHAAFTQAVARGKLTADAARSGAARLALAPTLADAVRDATVIIEAAPERLDLKVQIFAGVEPLVTSSALLASNTSSLSISAIATTLRHPERMLGLHFFNPVHAMRLLEIVRGERTSDASVVRARALSDALGKTAIVVRDTPGFATSRLGVVLGLEAIRMLEQGVASAEDIDRALELGYNHPMGPLRLTDLVGLDVRLAIADHLHATLRDETYAPPALLRRMVAEGKLGRKSGEGFYRWETDA